MPAEQVRQSVYLKWVKQGCFARQIANGFGKTHLFSGRYLGMDGYYG
jgi:hypothetical protein